ncbi:antifreeze protein [Paramagnetospirillum marisnigri]|uniref:Antifreeze protein n=1 Tax=Paramagnetospirillum marisnigri TaxID=1285242 RepID=A0A178ML22_9PROT|nr:antifreeze protein [Paramagnetospirillum marisnigri]OAN48704.1 antifreeze protein [Paramagnetospirillum marisnigri]
MPASRAKGLHVLVLAGMALASPAALAQGQPMPLGPPAAHHDESGPTPTVLKTVPSPSMETTPVAPPSDGRFQMEELKAPDLEAIGILDERQGGFGTTMWQGTSASVVRYHTAHLPVANGSRTARSLARRLLLSAAVPPEGGKGMTPSLVELRAERLYAMGEVEGLAALLKATPAAVTSPGLTRLKIDAYLLAGDTKAACAESATLVGSADPRMQAFCMLSSGKVLEANMMLDLMRERKDADHAFIAAAEAMGGTPPAKVDKLPNPTPLHLAAFKAAKMPLPADAANSSHPALLRAIAEAPGLPVDVRIPAAERAEALGALDTDTLRKIYGAVTFTPAEQQAAQGIGDKTPRARVLLLRAAQQEASPSVRADLITRILAAAAERGAFAGTARLYAPIIADLRPSPDLAPFAAGLARALFAAARPEGAGGWVALAKSDPASARAADDLWPLARLYRGGETAAAGAETYGAWLGARELPADQAERRALVGLELLQAVGEKVPAAQWMALPQTGLSAIPTPRPALKAQLRAASEGHRLGETVLLALAALGDAGLDKVDAEILNRVVVYLRQAGLEREARDLAVEAALANGV